MKYSSMQCARVVGRSRIAIGASSLLALLLGTAVATGAGLPPVWGAATKLNLPADAITAPGAQNSSASGVWCASPGNCVVVGLYKSSGGNYEPMVLSETGGAWTQPRGIPLPGGATTSPGKQEAGLNRIGCTSPGNCVTVGHYVDTGLDLRPMVDSETGGVWAQSTEVGLPAGGSPGSGVLGAYLFGVNCATVGNCAAVGRYADSTSSIQAMVVNETHGVWVPSKLALPAGAATGAGKQYAALANVACTAPGECVATGYYADSSGGQLPMIATEAGGIWAPATKITLPVDAAANATQSASLNSVSCTGPGACVAVGSYVSTADITLPMVIGSIGGVWGQASSVSVPSNAASPPASVEDELDSVSCAAAGSCTAVGSYRDTNDNGQTMVVTYSGGSWSTGTELSLPADAATTAGSQHAAMGALDCSTPAACEAVGAYLDTTGSVEPMVFSSLAQLVLTTSSLPSAVVGVHYAAQLHATGGSGRYAWTAGALPTGLHLNTATGVISGVPQQASTALVAVHAADAGPPSQAASANLVLRIAKPKPPNTVLTGHKIHRHTATFKLKATGVARGFQCALVTSGKPHFRRCAARKAYAHLARGHYVFEARAIGPGGHDPTPARFKFRIA